MPPSFWKNKKNYAGDCKEICLGSKSVDIVWRLSGDCLEIGFSYSGNFLLRQIKEYGTSGDLLLKTSGDCLGIFL